MEHVMEGIQVLLSWQCLLAVVCGVGIGMMFGLTPGLDATSGTALLIPFTYGMQPTTAIVLLASLYAAASYAGSITAICIGTPGTPAAAATLLDGYPLMKKGRAGEALFVALYASVIGGLVSNIMLALTAGPLAAVALRFGPVEYFALALFGLTIVAGLSGRNWLKGFLVAALGLLIVTIGIDSFVAAPRFTFGNVNLLSGISFVPALVGLFALSEALVSIEELGPKTVIQKVTNKIPSLKEIKGLSKVIAVSTAIGAFLGALPGVGAATACWIGYNQARNMSKHPEVFGKGSLEGVAAPQAADNGSVSTALIPLLTMGIPGSATAAVLLGAFTLHGLTVGPELFEKNGSVVYGLIAALFLANIVMGIMGFFGIRVWTKFLELPKGALTALIFAFAVVGSYSLRNSLFDVGTMLVFGIMGFILRKYNFPLAPMVLALVLGPMIESNFRRAMAVSDNGALIFLTRPISLLFIILAIISFVLPFIQLYIAKKKAEKSGLSQDEVMADIEKYFSD
ncbi:MAG: tripartite tricarboxylate transporter permease [Desulfitobacterium sp.]